MFDGLLGRGFAAKCKSLIKLTKNRIDVIRRKRKATEKFLKKDIADLLANGLDVNAYGRAEGLFVELTLSSCYDFVEQSCEFVLKHLSVLQKVSGCPEECREAISSLMFAAARFSDLPELRELRQIFQERYETSLECYVNQEFAANLNSKCSTLEKKVRLMHDIASEFSIKWDSKAFELRMSKSSASPASAQGHNTFKSDHMTDYGEPAQGKDGSRRKPTGCSSQNKREKQSEGGSNLHGNWGTAMRVKESQDAATASKSPGHVGGFRLKNNVNEPLAVGGLSDVNNPERTIQKAETPRVKSFYNNAIPPPYVKPNSKLKNSMPGTNSVTSHIDTDGIPTYSLIEKPGAASTTDRIQLGMDDSEQDLQATRHARPSKQGRETELSTQEDATEVPVLKPKSIRRKHSKSRSIHDDASNEGAEVVGKIRSRRRDEQKRGLQILFDDERHKKDEEERIIDRLLIHYSNKPSIPMPEKARRKSKSRHANHIDDSTHESLKNGSRHGPDGTPEMATHPPRSVSLPHEQTEVVKVNKVYARAASLQPDRSNEARHVHPNLPDYEDLAARIAALRGT